MPRSHDAGDGGQAGAGRCELCQRDVRELTRHHLIPQSRHGNKRTRRAFTREEVKTRLALLCRPCHDHVHATVALKELERSWNSVAALAAHPDIARFVAWIAKRPDGTAVPVVRNRNNRY